MQSSIDLIATSYLSCEEAKNVLLKLERQKDNCRYPKDDPGFVDNTAKESPHKVLRDLEQQKDNCRFPKEDLSVVDTTARESSRKAKEWIATTSCPLPS